MCWKLTNRKKSHNRQVFKTWTCSLNVNKLKQILHIFVENDKKIVFGNYSTCQKWQNINNLVAIAVYPVSLNFIYNKTFQTKELFNRILKVTFEIKYSFNLEKWSFTLLLWSFLLFWSIFDIDTTLNKEYIQCTILNLIQAEG